MIIIWDNGEQWDAHDVRFFEVPPVVGTPAENMRLVELVPVFERLLQRDSLSVASHAKILAVAHDLYCCNGWTPEPLADILWPSRLFKWARNPVKYGRSVSNIVPYDEAWQLGRPLVGKLIEGWKTWIGKRPDPCAESMGDTRVMVEAAEAWVRSGRTSEDAKEGDR